MASKAAPLFLTLVLLIAGCSRLAVWLAPTRHPAGERTAPRLRRTVSSGRRCTTGIPSIPEVLIPLKAAYLQNPSDPVTAAHVGWMHIWRLAERARLDGAPPDPGVTDDAVLARKYFEEACASIRARRGISASTPRS